MRLDEHALHAGRHFDHEQRRLDGAARLAAQLEPDRFGLPCRAGIAADAHPKPLAAQRAMRPGERRRIVGVDTAARLRQPANSSAR
jgi:hypothetical protein